MAIALVAVAVATIYKCDLIVTHFKNHAGAERFMRYFENATNWVDRSQKKQDTDRQKK